MPVSCKNVVRVLAVMCSFSALQAPAAMVNGVSIDPAPTVPSTVDQPSAIGFDPAKPVDFGSFNPDPSDASALTILFQSTPLNSRLITNVNFEPFPTSLDNGFLQELALSDSKALIADVFSKSAPI